MNGRYRKGGGISGGSRPSDKGAGGGGHPDPEIRGSDFGLKIRGERAPPLDPPLGIGKRREVPSTILEKL